MASVNLTATPRADTGKGAARQLRAKGQVPAVIYGHHREAQSVALNTRELEKLLDRIAAESTVVELAVEGKSSRTLIREIQRHPFRRQILHVDFQELVAGEKVTVRVPIVLSGTSEGVRLSGGILDQVMRELEIEVDPANIPNHIDVDIGAMQIGHALHVSDLKLPAGVEVLDDAEQTVCVVAAPRASETPAAGVETVAEAAPEPELIRKPKDDEGAEEEK
ncbi:MAG TPA: 50S ribosomal protein L25/general stress protein Ctc [Gemmatimonadaceae bacterium]|nr:50S ribosomal protein L25/general stress protein Ctc [Gemmatimonadaceae bacterium]